VKTFTFVLLSFFTKSGTLTNYETKIRYQLECPEGNYSSCYFDIQLSSGFYEYISYDKKDTTFLLVGRGKSDIYIYKTTGEFILSN
jgi:hypothetical protein